MFTNVAAEWNDADGTEDIVQESPMRSSNVLFTAFRALNRHRQESPLTVGASWNRNKGLGHRDTAVCASPAHRVSAGVPI